MFRRSSYCDSSACLEVGFRKATATASAGNGACVEVAFMKSSFCDTGTCVEVGTCDCSCDAVLIRDSKDQDGPLLRYTRLAWAEFLAGAKAGEFELPVA